jgi:hypothetical protein
VRRGRPPGRRVPGLSRGCPTRPRRAQPPAPR